MKLLCMAAIAGVALAQTPDIDQIMSRVARNQAKAQDARTDWIYTQKQLLRMHHAGGKLAREERREYLITPKARGIRKTLTHFEGKYGDHGKEVAYDHPKYQSKSLDIDGEVIDDMSNDMTDAQDSRDGIARDFFPLTYHQQLRYNFVLKGTETYHGREVYRVAFEPKEQKSFDDWKGEALIDTAEFQPVLVQTALALKIPMPVKVILGTNVHGFGFSVSYQKFAQGVWFPVSYGGEFEVRVAFFYRRKISVSMTNSDFHHTDVTTNIAYALDDK